MKFMIGVDCEGPACVVGRPDQTLLESGQYDFTCRQATREANAAARALFDAGAEEVVVWDNHGGSLNLIYEELDSRCKIALGKPFAQRWPGLDETFSGIVFIGYHGMDHSGGILDHTFSSKHFDKLLINGQEIGEVGFDAAVAGDFGVPGIFIAGDNVVCDEAKRFMPHIETAALKKAFSRHAAISVHPQQAVKMIYDGVSQAVKNIENAAPLVINGPITMDLSFKNVGGADWAMGQPGTERIDPLTIRRQFEKMVNINL